MRSLLTKGILCFYDSTQFITSQDVERETGKQRDRIKLVLMQSIVHISTCRVFTQQGKGSPATSTPECSSKEAPQVSTGTAVHHATQQTENQPWGTITSSNGTNAASSAAIEVNVNMDIVLPSELPIQFSFWILTLCMQTR